MKGLSSLIRNAVLATAMVLLPSAASAWSGMSLVYGGSTITKGTVLATLTDNGGDYRFLIPDALVYSEYQSDNGGFIFVPQCISGDEYGDASVANAYLQAYAAYTFSSDVSYGLTTSNTYTSDLSSVTGWFTLSNYKSVTASSTGYYVIQVYWQNQFNVNVYHVDSTSDVDGGTTAIVSSVTFIAASVDSDKAGFWFYSPDIFSSSVSDCLNSKYFKFSKERVRGGGTELSNFVSFNVQEFILNKLAGTTASSTKTITFYILYSDGENTVVLGPSTTTDIRVCASSATVTKINTYDADNNTSVSIAQYLGEGVDVYEYNAMEATTYSSSMPPGFTLTLYGESYMDTTSYNHESFTLLVDYESNVRLRFLANGSYFGATDLTSDTLCSKSDDYYLVGNFDSSTAAKNINPFNGDNKKTLTKYYYYNSGNYSTTEPSSYTTDSIVYKTTVAAPTDGFSGLYLVVFPKDYLDQFSSGTHDGTTVDYTTMDVSTYDDIDAFYNSTEEKYIEKTYIWYRAIRPQEEFEYVSPSSYSNNTITGGYDGLDATALHGGLYSRKRSNPWLDTQQAFNPSELDSVTALVFSMNVTTSTYNIELVTANNGSIYIVGPAVGGSEDSKAWTGVAFGTSNDKYSHELTLDDDGVYKYMVNGTETDIAMKKGSEFCFVRGSNWTGYVFQEDEVVPCDLSGDTNCKESDVYQNATSAGTYAETQYVNIMDVNTAGIGQSDYDSDKVSPMTFNLPSGSYYVRLYWGFDVTGNLTGSNSGVTKTFYTITPRTNTFTCPDATAIPDVSYNAFKAYCDYHAVVLPDSIDAYYVTYVSSENSTSESSSATARGAASMVKVDFSNYSKRVLPANTPVYLAISHARGSATGLQTIASTDIEYYDHPWYTNDLTEGNLLVGAIERCTIPKTTTSDGATYYNYMLGYAKANSSDSKPTWGFYTPDGASKCAINSVYLQTDVNIDNDLTSSSSSNYIALSFEGATTDDSETTAIDAIESVTGDGDDAYYTLQGFKLAAEPTLKGIYIHNGKKVIIK